MQVEQFRWNTNKDDNLSISDDGKLTIPNMGYIHQFGIQALPGTTVSIGNGNMIIGQQGNLQLDLGENYITTITITPHIVHPVIVDILYDEGGTIE